MLLLLGCEPEMQWNQLNLELLRTPGCEIGALESLELRALGDFPAQREAFDLSSEQAAFESFPLDTLELTIEGRFADDARAGGRTLVPGALTRAEGAILMVPQGRSCPLADEALIASEGVAAAPLPDGGLLLAGGTKGDEILRSALVLPAGGTLVEEVPDGMLLRRRYASATRAGGLVVVAGGVSSERGGAEETYEIFDSARGAFAREQSHQLSAGPRMQHGAALLPDGRVLLVGGRAEPEGAPLSSAELIQVDLLAPQASADEPLLMGSARAAPQVIVLDSGVVIVAGGLGADGRVVPTLERFEVQTERFVPLGLTLSAFEHTAAVGLPGGRVAWIGCDTTLRAACGLELVLLRGEEPVRVDVPLDWAGQASLGLRDLRALALEDGRVLITGREPDANMRRRALVLDIGLRELTPDDASRAPSLVLLLADGAIIELDGVGASLRRVGGLSAYESPEGDLVGREPALLALDAPDRWQSSEAGLRALLSGARLDLTRLRLGAFRLELALEGRALLRLRADGLPELALPLAAREPAGPDCPQLPAAGELVVERHGTQLELWSDARPDARCTLEAPSDGPLSIALEAEADAQLRSFRISRL